MILSPVGFYESSRRLKAGLNSRTGTPVYWGKQATRLCGQPVAGTAGPAKKAKELRKPTGREIANAAHKL